MAGDTRAAIEAVWHIESARIIARLARMVGDLGLAEELAQDTLVTALERWPEEGIPDNPGGWLAVAAKRRAIDHLRREKLSASKPATTGYVLLCARKRSVSAGFWPSLCPWSQRCTAWRR